MTILITGGAGYIGSHIAHLLVDAGMDVIAIDDLSAGFRHLLPAKAPLFIGSYGDREFLGSVLDQNKIGAVMHVGGSVQVAESILHPERYFENNVTNTKTLIDETVKRGIKHFIFSSTAAVYGQSLQSLCREDDPVAPISPYGQSKLLAEKLFCAADAENGIGFVALRYFNVAGADPKSRTGQSTTAPTHLIKRAVQTAMGMRSELAIYGTDYPTPDGTCIRDYIHVSDVARANLEALRYLGDGGQSITLNCGSGRGLSVHEVVQSVKRVSGHDFPVVLHPRRVGDPPALVAVSARIRASLGWQPQIEEIDEVVRHQLAWELKLRDRAERETI